MKLNMDAGFDNDLLEGTVGAVLRDHKGKFVAPRKKKGANLWQQQMNS